MVYLSAANLRMTMEQAQEILEQDDFAEKMRSLINILTKELEILGLGQKIRLSRQASFFWGVATKPLTYGGGVRFLFKNLAISYATTIHPDLGLTHTISLGFISIAGTKEQEEFD